MSAKTINSPAGYGLIPGVLELPEDKGYKIIEIDAPDAYDGLKAMV